MESLRAAWRRLRRRGPEPAASGVSREAVERLVGMAVDDLALFEQALKHRSRLRGRPHSHRYSNERLEFLGDAVLGFVVGEHLYRHFPDQPEGFLTRLRAKLVNGQALAHYAEGIALGPLILMSENMVQTAGRQNQTILADAFEAVIGAVYLDQGLPAARRFIHRAMLDQVDLDALAKQRDNYKSLLLEHAQGEGWPQPVYRVVAEEGPSHDRRFTVEVLLRGEPYGSGRARSKKSAEQKAARQALQRLHLEETADDEDEDDA
ncbi:MAG: ribonuclease III [Rhodothermales bacterium]|nr:ribonuclease III [Rhodothermales bacterium]